MKKLFLNSIYFFALLGAITACQTNDINPTENSNSSEQALNVGRTEDGYEVVVNEYIVKFKAGTSEAKQDEILSRMGGKMKEKLMTRAMERAGDRTGIMLVNLPIQAQEALAKARGFGEIEYIEPNYVYRHNSSNDTYFTNGSLWGMYGATSSPANQFGCGAAIAWAAGKRGSNTVYIGVIDEGYMFNHEDLAANAGVNPGEIAGNGRDDDGNGYVDDVYGWDFAGNDNSVFDGVNDDHGTHCAGTIGAVGNNGRGVAGVVWNVKLLGAKFLGSTGGTTANAIKAIDYFTDLKTRQGLNIVATNNSWGGGGFSQALQDAIERANQAGILFVAAAGNNGTNNDVTPSYPASYPNSNIIAVASITSTGALSSFSQFGATSVDIGAPGSGVWSTVPVRQGGRIVSGYASYNGTSMATPHVTGAVALYKSINPSATAAQIKNAIMNSAIPTPSLSGRCVTGGRLNVSGF